AGVGRLHEATGRPVLTAAAVGQSAHEGEIGDSGETHGYFTWAVLDALRHGDTNGNGLIELSELVAHVETVVPRIAAKGGGGGRAVTSETVDDRQVRASGHMARTSSSRDACASERRPAPRGQKRVIFHRGVYVSFRRQPVVRSTAYGRFDGPPSTLREV